MWPKSAETAETPPNPLPATKKTAVAAQWFKRKFIRLKLA